MKLFVVRHGQTMQNLGRIYQGQMDGDLSDEGKIQAFKLGKRFEDIDFDVAFSSDLKRAVHTANQIMLFHYETPINYVSQLRERSWGIYEGKSIHDHRFDIFNLPEGVENTQHVYDRITKFFEEIYDQYRNKTVLFVTHSLVCRLYTAYFLGINLENIYDLPKPKNTGLYEIQINDNSVKIVLENDISHLN